ncbi:amidohydrolase family protein [Streptomyces mirabilis]|uniref:amidohydrolase family protein n=1 Tax=Streptomyces mirabilis TaxID=68239 RepID=UPI003718650F
MNTPTAVTGPFALPDVTLVQPTEHSTPHAVLAVRGDRIAALRTDPRSPADRVLEEYRGAYVVPGLVDMHTHLAPGSPLHVTEASLLTHLAHGVTALRDAGDSDGTSGPTARRAMEQGHPGPRLSTAGSFVTRGRTRWPNSLQLAGPRQADDLVARIADAGNQWIKSYEGLDPEDIAALVVAAEKRGLGVIGHVPSHLRHEHALLPDTQHFFGVPDPADLSADTVVCRATDWQHVDERRLDEVVRNSLSHGLAHTPTVVATEMLLSYHDYPKAKRAPATALLPPLYANQLWHPTRGFPVYRNVDGARLARVARTLGQKLRLIGDLHAAGVRLHLGTDSPQPFTVPGAALHTEMELFARAGIAPAEVWHLATRGNAKVLGPALGEPDLGLLSPGAPADLLVYRDDPTTAISPDRGLLAVVAQGRIYPRQQLDSAVAAHQARLRRLPARMLGAVGATLALRSTDFDF